MDGCLSNTYIQEALLPGKYAHMDGCLSSPFALRRGELASPFFFIENVL